MPRDNGTGAAPTVRLVRPWPDRLTPSEALVALIYSESALPITPIYLWNHVSGTILKFFFFKVVNNNKYFSYVVDSIIFGISVPDYHSRTVESKSLRLFWNFSIFCLLYIHINNNKFTCDKFKSAKFGFNIFDVF